MTGWPRAVAALCLLLAWTAGASAASSVKLPPPDLRGLVPLAALPLDKPPVPMPAIALPPPPEGLPDLPAPRIVSDPVERPMAPMPSPRLLACNPIGTVLGVSSELLECGRARYQRGELEEARQAFQRAIQESSDRDVLRESRYWLGVTLLRLGRKADVENTLLLVLRDEPRSEFGLYAADELGWLALDLGAPARALGYFDGLLKIGPPPALLAYARHGRAIALYGLKRYAEARDEWAGLLNLGGFSRPNAPSALVSEANFWLGETLGRLGDAKGAVARLEAFTSANPRHEIASGFLRLGWWSRAAGQPLDAVKAYRILLSAYPRAPEALWARAGLVQALLDQGDEQAAREEARQLDGADRARSFSLPAWLLIRQWLADKARADEARALDDDLLARTLRPATRAWVLLVSAETARQSGQADEARSRFEMVRQSPGLPYLGLYAALRLAQIDFDLRQFAQAEAQARSLVSQPLPADVRVAALVLAGEAAYWARDYDEAVGFYTRFLADLAGRPEAPKVGMALGWAEFRRGNFKAARERWVAFAREAPSDPGAADALLLSADLAARAGDVQEARTLLGQVVVQFENSEQAKVATLNRSILAIDGEHPADALPELSLLVLRAPTSPFIGRIHLAKGIALLGMGRAAAAAPDFQAALGQGDDVVSHLGLGVIAFTGSDWGRATREFTAARDAGSGAAAAAAQYGLAAAAFNDGKADEFARLAPPLLSGPEDRTRTPALLLGMAATAAEQKRWSDARDTTVRLESRFPKSEAAGDALATVGAAAGADSQWALAREMYEILAREHAGHPGNLAGRLTFGEALLETGAPAEARRELDAFVKASPGDPRLPRALLLLAKAQEAGGNRSAAIELYRKVEREYPRSPEQGTVALSAARLLVADGKWSEARPILERALDQPDPEIVAEAAFRLGEGFRSAGRNTEATEAYMTAAYLDPDSRWARRALLGAGQSFTALNETESAAIVYKKLLAGSSVEPELAVEARTRLKGLVAN